MEFSSLVEEKVMTVLYWGTVGFMTIDLKVTTPLKDQQVMQGKIMKLEDLLVLFEAKIGLQKAVIFIGAFRTVRYC